MCNRRSRQEGIRRNADEPCLAPPFQRQQGMYTSINDLWCRRYAATGAREEPMRISRRNLLRWSAGAAPATSQTPLSQTAWAQAYPTRPVRVVVPVAAGGNNGLFHNTSDRGPDAIDLNVIARFASAFATVATSLARI